MAGDFFSKRGKQTNKPKAPAAGRYLKEDKEEERLTWQQNLMSYVHDLIYMMSTIAVIFLLVFRIIVVSGSSMKQTLVDGDYLLLLSNVFYREPQQGDVVVICKKSFDDGKSIVKRVIATEGQTVDIDFEAAIVYVDGVALVEPYINTPTNVSEGTQFPLTVEEGCIFVLGDNRGVSRDSRDPAIGQIDKREVLGKALYLTLPGTEGGEHPRDYSRTGAIK